jgi:hypothetical protein
MTTYEKLLEALGQNDICDVKHYAFELKEQNRVAGRRDLTDS